MEYSTREFSSTSSLPHTEGSSVFSTRNHNLRTGCYFQVLFCSLKVWMRKGDNSAGPGWSPCLGPTVSLLSEMQQTIFNQSPVHQTNSVEYSAGLQLVPAAQCADLEALPASVKAPGSRTGASSLKNFSCNCLLSSSPQSVPLEAGVY